MKVKIMGREDLTDLAKEPFPAGTAIISITNTDLSELELTNLPEHLLRLKFDDVSDELYEDFLGRKPSVQEMKQLAKRFHMFSDEQAKEIANFILPLYESVDTLICQCEHGQSRSAGVAAAILEYFSRSGVTVFAATGYYPNKLVYRRLLHYLNRCGGRKKES